MTYPNNLLSGCALHISFSNHLHFSFSNCVTHSRFNASLRLFWNWRQLAIYSKRDQSTELNYFCSHDSSWFFFSPPNRKSFLLRFLFSLLYYRRIQLDTFTHRPNHPINMMSSRAYIITTTLLYLNSCPLINLRIKSSSNEARKEKRSVFWNTIRVHIQLSREKIFISATPDICRLKCFNVIWPSLTSISFLLFWYCSFLPPRQCMMPPRILLWRETVLYW